MKDGNFMEADVAPVIPFAPYYRYLNYNKLMVVIGHVKLNSLDLKQPIKPQITAVNNQS